MESHPRRKDFRHAFRLITRLAGALFLLSLALPDAALANGLLPSSPESEFLPVAADEPTVDFCSEWNPEFAYRGHRCCGVGISRNIASRARRGRSAAARCAPSRTKWSFCDEMTAEQRQYVEDVKSGRIKDPLKFLEARFDRAGKQSFCSSLNGFLVAGKPLLMTKENRIELRNPARCSNFGTDRLVAVMEWLGREVNREFHEPEFSKARLTVGDLSAPRGSCISGRGGRRAHKSHTTGVDVDFAFFNPRSGGSPEERFTRNFYVASNWWMLKRLFRNPYACVKVVFVDNRHIRMLKAYAKNDPDWEKLSPYIRHIKGHRDHFHLRVGETAGGPGCLAEGPSLENDEEMSDAALVEEGSPDANGDNDGDEENGSPLPPGVAQADGAADSSKTSLVHKLTHAMVKNADAAGDEFRLAHKQEPSITQKLQSELRPKRRARSKKARKRR